MAHYFMPDFQRVQSFDEIQSQFIKSARSIMYSHVLVYGESERSWHITALELYLCTVSNIWRDPYTHGNRVQLQSGTWYVHDHGDRAPFYSGIDITCGSTEHGIYGGMLIRELCNEHRWVFQRIVRGAHLNLERKGNRWCDEEKSIIQGIHTMPLDHGPLKLVSIPENDGPLYLGPRIGLKSKQKCSTQNPEGISFRCAALRVATWETALLKTKMTLCPSINPK